MIKVGQFLLILALAVKVSAATVCSKNVEPIVSLKKKTIQLVLKRGVNRNVELNLDDVADDPSDPYYKSIRWGSLGAPEAMRNLRVIGTIEVKVGKKSVPVPLGSYSDLSNVNLADICLIETQKGFNVELTGGDAVYSYKAIFYFSQSQLLKRLIKMGELKSAESTTIYK